MKITKKSIQKLSILVAFSITFSSVILVQPKAVEAKTVASSSKATQIINIGNRYLGTPYKFGASTTTTQVFDCSSFTKYVYGKNRIQLPRTSIQQARQGNYVSRNNLKKGDLVFFSTRKSGSGKIGHVGIYVGNGKMLHTYGAGGVKYSTMKTGWWSEHYITARRVM